MEKPIPTKTSKTADSQFPSYLCKRSKNVGFPRERLRRLLPLTPPPCHPRRYNNATSLLIRSRNAYSHVITNSLGVVVAVGVFAIMPYPWHRIVQVQNLPPLWFPQRPTSTSSTHTHTSCQQKRSRKRHHTPHNRTKKCNNQPDPGGRAKQDARHERRRGTTAARRQGTQSQGTRRKGQGTRRKGRRGRQRRRRRRGEGERRGMEVGRRGRRRQRQRSGRRRSGRRVPGRSRRGTRRRFGGGGGRGGRGTGTLATGPPVPTASCRGYRATRSTTNHSTTTSGRRGRGGGGRGGRDPGHFGEQQQRIALPPPYTPPFQPRLPLGHTTRHLSTPSFLVNFSAPSLPGPAQSQGTRREGQETRRKGRRGWQRRRRRRREGEGERRGMEVGRGERRGMEVGRRGPRQ